MALFGFGKPKIKKPQEFYKECLSDFHHEAAQYGVATKGMILIPELMPSGEKIVKTFLDDPFLKMEYGNDPQTFYYAVMLFVIESGMVFAAKWHDDFRKLNAYVDAVADVGPADDANALLEKHFPADISLNQGNSFFQKIYVRWIALHAPYWEMSDPRLYTFNAMMAAYQLGVSMMLEKLGY